MPHDRGVFWITLKYSPTYQLDQCLDWKDLGWGDSNVGHIRFGLF